MAGRAESASVADTADVVGVGVMSACLEKGKILDRSDFS